MKKLLALVLCSQGLLFADTAPVAPTQKPKPWLKDQNDQTDTYAVPLDSSEEEEEQELDEFENAKKQQPKPAAK